MLRPQVAYTGSHVLLPWDDGKRKQVGFHHDVGKATLPVTEFEVGQDDLTNVPAIPVKEPDEHCLTSHHRPLPTFQRRLPGELVATQRVAWDCRAKKR